MTSETRQQPRATGDGRELDMAVIGTGYFGSIHARKLAAMPGVRLVAVADIDGARAAALAAELGVEAVTDQRELYGRVSAACVVVPTRLHGEVAAGCLENGIDVLVEKPIAHDLPTARRLIDLARERGRILQVGHLERYSGLVDALRRHEVRPSYIESLRISPFRSRATDVNVILDMMIHDIDLLLCLVGAPLLSVDAAGASVFTGLEDIASVRLKFANGCVASVVASRVSLKTERRMRLFESSRYVAVDLVGRQIRVMHKPEGADPNDPGSYALLEETYAEQDALEQELRDFRDSVRDRRPPAVDGRVGAEALEAALRITASMREHERFSGRARGSGASGDDGKASDKTAGAAAPRLPLVDLGAQYARLGGAIEPAVVEVLRSGAFIGGSVVATLEAELARYTGAGHAVSVANGTDALRLPLMDLGIGPGDAVFVPSFTFIATAGAVVSMGATPVFVDIDETTCTMDPHDLARAVWDVRRAGKLRPRAAIPVDLFGRPANYAALDLVADEHGLVLIADAAQSLGAALGERRVGKLAAYTATSFYPSKPLGGYGDGGCVFTDDDRAAASLRALRQHGLGSDGVTADRAGINSRLDALQAAVLLEKLRVFPEELEARARVAATYAERLDGVVQVPRVAPPATTTWAVYTIRSPRRDRVRDALESAGISTAQYYRIPVHLQPAYRRFGRGEASLPVTERLCRDTLALPIHAYLGEAEIGRICDVIGSAVQAPRGRGAGVSV